MFHVTNIRKISWSEIRTQHIAETSPTRLWNNISDVIFHYFFPILEKYRELKPACQTIGRNSTPYDQRIAVSGTIEISREMYNARLFFVVLTAWR